MKVLLINGSPNETGCTYTALTLIAKALAADGVETEIFWAGAKPIGGCIGCSQCKGKGRCVFDGVVNQLLDKAETADGFVFGSPVHFAGISGNMKCLLDRAFCAGKDAFRYKPAAVAVSARRAGTTASLDELLKYPTINQMPVVSSGYWTMVHGQKPSEVLQDAEGCAVMDQLGHNMAWLLRCIDAGKQNGVAYPTDAPRPRTNFIR